MALTTLSVENRITAIMADLSRNGLTSAGVCRLLVLQGIPIGVSKFSQALTGIRPFENAEGTKVIALLSDLVELRDSNLPLPISFRDPAPIAPLLESIRRARREVPEPRIFSVRSQNHYFVSKNDIGRIDMTFGIMMAATMSRPVADRVAETLKALGYEQVEVIPNGFKGLDGLHVSFESLMGLPETEDNNVIIETNFEAQ